MDLQLIESWINQHAPDSIKYHLLSGAKMFDYRMAKDNARIERFPNLGMLFTDEEVAELSDLAEQIMGYNFNRCELERKFGRPMSSIRSKCRIMIKKGLLKGT
jgi:hypothetical protein